MVQSRLAVDPELHMPITWSIKSLPIHLGLTDSTFAQSAPLEAISIRARREGIRVDHVLHDDSAHYPAINSIARQSEVCIVFVSLFLVEAWDRTDLRLDRGGEELIKVVEKGCAGQVVVVMHIGGQVIMEDWVGHQLE